MNGPSSTNPGEFSEIAGDIALIEQALRCRLGHRVRDLRIWVEPHGVIIAGSASSYYDKQMAQHLVSEAGGLAVADNRIVVDSQRAEPSFDRNTSYHNHEQHPFRMMAFQM